MKGYKKGTLLEEYFLNPHFKPTPKEEKELDDFFKLIKKDLTKDVESCISNINQRGKYDKCNK